MQNLFMMLKNLFLTSFTKKQYILIGFIFFLNLLQAFFTGLHGDEAYYWYYSQHLNFGYFDHPPMVALFIFLGNLISHSQLGVRLFMIFLSTLTTMIILHEFGDKKEVWLSGLFIMSFPLFHTHIGGFMALPDVPLVFFTLLFFITYRRFLRKPDTVNSVLIGIVASAMVYSKYHAFLIIGFTVLSNIKLLKNKKFYIAVLVFAILMSPHILWQINNGFPSVKYNLYSRIKPFGFKYVLPNIGSQLAVIGPFTFPFILWALYKFKTNHSFFRKALIYNILGFYIFFFLFSFKNRIEAHWTVAIAPLIMMITYPEIMAKDILKKWFKVMATISFILILFVRSCLAFDFAPFNLNIRSLFYKKEATSDYMKQMANGLPVAFFNAFGKPSNYMFYEGDSCLCLAMPDYRYCEFDIIQQQDGYNGDSLFAFMPPRFAEDSSQIIILPDGKKMGTKIIHNFQSLKNLNIYPETISCNDSIVRISVKLKNKSNSTIFFEHISKPLIAFMQNKKEILNFPLSSYSVKLEKNETCLFNVDLPNYLINKDRPLIIYTRSLDGYRGEMGVVNLK